MTAATSRGLEQPPDRLLGAKRRRVREVVQPGTLVSIAVAWIPG